jgi:hypothetical protein
MIRIFGIEKDAQRLLYHYTYPKRKGKRRKSPDDLKAEKHAGSPKGIANSEGPGIIP